jgi:hypothetical protein
VHVNVAGDVRPKGSSDERRDRPRTVSTFSSDIAHAVSR